MKTAIAHLKSVSPFQFSKFYEVPKLDKETSKDFEARTWRNRAHATKDGYAFIPPMAFKLCLSNAAQFLGTQIPGKGKSTYTKHFKSGVLVQEALVLPIKVEDLEALWLHVPSDGVKGGGKRVSKCFPVVQEWEGDVTFHILSEAITKDVFLHTLEEAGRFIGIGAFRPQNDGYFGRFEVTSLKWG